MKPTFFIKPPDFRKWLQRNHKKETETKCFIYRLGPGNAWFAATNFIKTNEQFLDG